MNFLRITLSIDLYLPGLLLKISSSSDIVYGKVTFPEDSEIVRVFS